MRRFFTPLLCLVCFTPLAVRAEIDEATRQRAIEFVGGLRPPPVTQIEIPAPVPTGTLKKLAEGGALYLGYRDDVMPLSFQSKDGKPAGLVWDLCKKVVDAASRELGLPSIPVVPVPVTPNTRELLLLTGTIDLECGATPNTVTRQRKVAFAVTTYVSSVRMLVRNGSGINAAADLANRAVVSLSGSSAERFVRTAAVLRGSNVRFLQARDVAEALSMVENNQADAFVGDDVALAAAMASMPSGRASKLAMAGNALAIEPLGIMLRKDDVQFKKLIDETLTKEMKSGEFETLYSRWFQSPVDGVNLNLPINDMLRNLLQAPNDQGI